MLLIISFKEFKPLNITYPQNLKMLPLFGAMCIELNNTLESIETKIAWIGTHGHGEKMIYSMEILKGHI